MQFRKIATFVGSPPQGETPGALLVCMFNLCLWLGLFMPGVMARSSAGGVVSTLAAAVLLYPLAFARSPALRVVTVSAVWTLGCVQLAYYLSLGSPIDTYLWLTLSTSDVQEAEGFLRQHATRLIPQTLGWVVLTGLIAARLARHPARRPWYRPWTFASALLVAAFAAAAALHANPVGFALKNVGQTYPFTVWHSLHERSQLAAAFRTQVPVVPAPAERALADTIVLVIGESSSRSRWQLFGYGVPTTPELVARGDIVAFSDVVSNANVTAAAVPMLLTGRDLGSLSPRDPTLIDLARRAGFRVSVLSNQGRHSEAEDPFGVMLRRADDFVQAGRAAHDEVLTAPFEKVLQNDGPQLIVLHTYGSHHTVSKRTPARFKVLQDDYDSSILYTDYLLSQWIGLLERQGRRAMLLYASDHGVETQACTGRYMHGRSTTSYEVPVVFWASPAVRLASQAQLQQAAANAARPFQNTVVFSSLADALGYPHTGYPSFLRPVAELPARSASGKPYAEVPAPTGCQAVRGDADGPAL